MRRPAGAKALVEWRCSSSNTGGRGSCPLLAVYASKDGPVVMMWGQQMSPAMTRKQGRVTRVTEPRAASLVDLDDKPVVLVACDHIVIDVSVNALRDDYVRALDDRRVVRRFLPDGDAEIAVMH